MLRNTRATFALCLALCLALCRGDVRGGYIGFCDSLSSAECGTNPDCVVDNGLCTEGFYAGSTGDYLCTSGSCSWSKFTQGVDWDYISIDNGSCQDCSEACDDLEDCTGFECDSGYCSYWKNGACSEPEQDSYITCRPEKTVVVPFTEAQLFQESDEYGDAFIACPKLGKFAQDGGCYTSSPYRCEALTYDTGLSELCTDLEIQECKNELMGSYYLNHRCETVYRGFPGGPTIDHKLDLNEGYITYHPFDSSTAAGSRLVITGEAYEWTVGRTMTFKVVDANGVEVAVLGESSLSGDTYPYLSMRLAPTYYNEGVEASLEFFITNDLVSPLYVQWPADYVETIEVWFFYENTQKMEQELVNTAVPSDPLFKLKMGDKCLHRKGKRLNLSECQYTSSSQEVEFNSGSPFLAVSGGDPVKISVGGAWLNEGMKKDHHTTTKKKWKGERFTLIPLYWTAAGMYDVVRSKRWTFQLMDEKSGECLSFGESKDAMEFMDCLTPKSISDRIKFNNQAIELEVYLEDCRTTGCDPPKLCNFYGVCEDYYFDTYIAYGRPFSLPDGTSALSPLAKEGAGESWCVAPVDEENSSLSSELSTALGVRWAEAGLAEHASVASFARFSLELMAVAAPPSLLIASHKAGLDEIHHAQLCFGLANLYNSNSTTGDETESTRYGPGAFPLQLEASESGVAALVSLMTSVALEGCVHETVSTIQASARLAQTTEPAVQKALKTIWEDEARHSALAWRTVRWALAELKVRGSAQEIADGVTALKKVFDTEIARVVNSFEADMESDLPQYGFVSGSALVEVVKEVAEIMLRPWSVAVLKTAALTAPADCTTVVGRAMCAVAAELENAF